MIHTKAVMRYPYYNVHIEIDDSGRIQLFKYNHDQCDFGVFYSADEASDFMLEPLPSIHYKIIDENGDHLL